MQLFRRSFESRSLFASYLLLWLVVSKSAIIRETFSCINGRHEPWDLKQCGLSSRQNAKDPSTSQRVQVFVAVGTEGVSVILYYIILFYIIVY